MSENFNDFLDSRLEELKNKKESLELGIEKAEYNNYKLDKIIEEYNKNVKKRKKIHFLLGIIGTIILNILVIKITNLLDVDLSKLGLFTFSLIDSIPLLVGIHSSLNSKSKIEKKMNIKLSKFESEIYLNNTLINNNTKKISKIDIILNELSYLKQVSDIYENGNIEEIIKQQNNIKENNKEKIKTLTKH